MATGFKPCSVQDCKANAHWTAKGIGGMCRSHYRRNRDHGSPFGGKARDGAPQAFLESAITFTGEDCLTWPYARNFGYGVMRVGGVNKVVHRLVCIAAHGEPPTEGHEAAHTCGRGSSGCVNPNHLRWATTVENEADKLVHGTHNRGERSGSAKLSRSDVLAIRELKTRSEFKAAAERYGVSYATIHDICHRRTWAWLD